MVEDGKNWADRALATKNKTVPQGPLCQLCADFGHVTGMTADDLARVRKDKRKAPQLKTDIELFDKTREGEPDAAPCARQRVTVSTTMTSSLQNEYDVSTRTAFKKEFGIGPEDAKLMQVNGMDGLGREINGVVVGAPVPKLVVGEVGRGGPLGGPFGLSESRGTGVPEPDAESCDSHGVLLR